METKTALIFFFVSRTISLQQSDSTPISQFSDDTMPLFRLDDSIVFPPAELAEPDGILAIGGDLRPERLIAAYSRGIFPWYSKGEPLLWWFTDPRLVLIPGEFHLPARLARYQRNSGVEIRFDTAFAEVISECAAIRTECGEETWLLPEMQDAYIRLHQLGYAHSVESWLDGRLVGGLYGIALDRVFFGESMFSRIANSSQYALCALVKYLAQRGTKLIDCQMTTRHLQRFGAKEIPGALFQGALERWIEEIRPQHWSSNG